MQELSWLIHPLLLSAKTLAITFVLLLFLGLGAAYFLAFYRGRFKALLEAAVMRADNAGGSVRRRVVVNQQINIKIGFLHQDAVNRLRNIPGLPVCRHTDGDRRQIGRAHV